MAGQAPSHGQPFSNICTVACSSSRVSTLDALLSRRLPLTSTKRPLGALQLGEPNSKVSGLVSPQDKGPPSHPAESAPADPCPPPTKLSAVEAPLSQGPSERNRQKPIEHEAGVSTEHSLVSREQQPPHRKSRPKLHLPARPPSNLSAPDCASGRGPPLAWPQNATCAHPPAFSSPFVPLAEWEPPTCKEADLHLRSPADSPSRPFNADPSPPQGQRPAPAAPHSGPHPQARWKPSPELSLDVPRVLVCLWPSAPLFAPGELAGRGCYLVEERYLIPVLLRRTSAPSSQKQRPEPAEGEEGGLGTLSKPPGNLGRQRLPDALVAPQRPEREGPAPAAPHPQQQFSHSVRLAGDREMGTGEPPGSKEARHPHPGGRSPRPLGQAGLGVPPRWPGGRLSVQALVVAASPGDRLGNASASWPARGAVQVVVPLVGLCAEVLMGRGPGALWPGTGFSRLLWCCVSWGVLVVWRVLSRGRAGCPTFKEEKLEELSTGMKLMGKALDEFDRKLKYSKTAFHRKRESIKNLSREVSELKELLSMSEENNQRWQHLFQLSQEGQVSLDVADAELGTRGHVPGEPQARGNLCPGTGSQCEGRWSVHPPTPGWGPGRGKPSWPDLRHVHEF